MGLAIGAAKIDYLEEPRGATRRFVIHLVENICDSDWSFGDNGNLMAQYTLDTMLNEAENYAATAPLGLADTEAVLEWVRRLPWQDYTVMLYMSW